MGNIFSKSRKSEAADNYQKTLADLKAEQDLLDENIQKANANIKLTMEQQFQRQKDIAKTRIAEIKETIRRAKELRDARKTLNVQAAVLLCALYYNYPFGTLDGALDDTILETESVTKSTISDQNAWSSNATSICDIAVNENVFWLLCKIPQLVPLLWPTGRSEDKFHQYKSRNAVGIPDGPDYLIELNTHLSGYVNNQLKKYVTNVFQANCTREMSIDVEYQESLYDACSQFIESVQNLANDNEWVNRAYAFIKNDDKMNWKGFVAKSGKGICNAKIMLLPSNYPHICPQYELYEALLMITNTVLNNFGQCKTYDGRNVVNSNESPNKPDVHGGQCFELKQFYIDNTYKFGINNETIWDGKSFVEVKSINIPVEQITGKTDALVWMQDTVLCDELEIQYLDNASRTNKSGGITRYKNPTKRITYQYINDYDGMKIKFQMPRISASINEQFTKSFLYRAFETLTSTPTNEKYDTYRTKNKAILTSIDYMTLRPPELDEWKTESSVAPVVRFIYTCLIENSCQWNLTIPINTTMSMGQINSQFIRLSNNDKSCLPQYLWTRSVNMPDKVQDESKVTLSNIPTPIPIMTDDIFVANDTIVVI